MKKYSLLHSFFTIFLLAEIFSVQLKGQNIPETRILKPAKMQQDFNYLRKALENTCPALYMHHTKEAMLFKMDSLFKLLNTPLTFSCFYKIVAYLIGEVKCEHTYCSPYGNDCNKQLPQWKLLPLQLFSSATSTCAPNAQSHKLAMIIDDETAGCFAGGGSTNSLALVLPNSRISAHTAIVYCEFNTSGKNKDRGVIPDYFVPALMN